MSVNDTDPALLFGGEWERIEGRFLLAANGTYKAGSIGGEATHKLTVAEMPSHSHGGVMTWSGSGNIKFALSNLPNVYNSGTSGYAGSSTAHNNMPPYLVVYVWQRIS